MEGTAILLSTERQALGELVGAAIFELQFLAMVNNHFLCTIQVQSPTTGSTRRILPQQKNSV